MARSHKPIVWSLFAAGGTVAAFVTPVLIVITGLALPLGLLAPDALAYDRAAAILHNPIGKVVAFGLVFLPLWHAAHRLRITAHDFGIRADGLVMLASYGLAAVGTIAAAAALVAI